MKSIILEGIDGVGKSTLARALSAYYGVGVHTIGGPPKNDNTALIMADFQIRIANHSTVVFDRVTSISRLCYERELGQTHIDVMCGYMKAMCKKCVVVWLTNPIPVNVPKEYDTDEHLQKIADDLLIIKSQYYDIMQLMPHVHYDYSDVTFQELTKELEEWL